MNEKIKNTAGLGTLISCAKKPFRGFILYGKEIVSMYLLDSTQLQKMYFSATPYLPTMDSKINDTSD